MDTQNFNPDATPSGRPDNQATDLDSLVEFLQESRKYVRTNLTDPAHLMIRTRIDNDYAKMIGFIGGATGRAYESGAGSHLQELAQDLSTPVTTFFGQPIDRPQPITERDLTPTDTERDNFNARRDDLYNRFTVTDDNSLLAMIRVPDGSRLIRAVAKRVGLDEWKTRTIDVDYLADTKRLLTERLLLQTADQRAQEAAAEHTEKGPNENLANNGGLGTGADAEQQERIRREQLQQEHDKRNPGGDPTMTGEEGKGPAGPILDPKDILGDEDDDDEDIQDPPPPPVKPMPTPPPHGPLPAPPPHKSTGSAASGSKATKGK